MRVLKKSPHLQRPLRVSYRLNFLRKAAHLQHCDHIVFGHQLDDIIETQLQRIARGSPRMDLLRRDLLLF